MIVTKKMIIMIVVMMVVADSRDWQTTMGSLDFMYLTLTIF
jgi:hypothetical protein